MNGHPTKEKPKQICLVCAHVKRKTWPMVKYKLLRSLAVIGTSAVSRPTLSKMYQVMAHTNRMGKWITSKNKNDLYIIYIFASVMPCC